ncbi:MAG: response regulator [Cyclobacteriaceae bacterium]
MKHKIKTIWSVDDDEIFLLLTSNFIKLTSYNGDYKTFTDGHYALEELYAHVDNPDNLPDLILLDINMPMVDAWEFIETFKKISLPKKIYIYIVSSSIDPADRKKATEYPEVEDFIEKPVNSEKLERILENYSY